MTLAVLPPLPPPPTADALIASALVLARAARGGAVQPLLRGKNFALVCDDPDSGDARAFRRAAGELGARVACIAPATIALPEGGDGESLGRMLSLLYDAVECQGLPVERVDALRHVARIPVHDDLARPNALEPRLAAALGGATGDARHYLLQAMLIASL